MLWFCEQDAQHSSQACSSIRSLHECYNAVSTAFGLTTKIVEVYAQSPMLAWYVAVQWLGKLSFVLVPLLVLLAVLVGAFAAKTYDSGANTYLAP